MRYDLIDELSPSEKVYQEAVERDLRLSHPDSFDDYMLARSIAAYRYINTPEAKAAHERWLKWKEKNDKRNVLEKKALGVPKDQREVLRKMFLKIKGDDENVKLDPWVEVGLKCYPDWAKMPDWAWVSAMGPASLECIELFHSYFKDEWITR